MFSLSVIILFIFCGFSLYHFLCVCLWFLLFDAICLMQWNCNVILYGVCLQMKVFFESIYIYI
jgi:hypothetical protein